MRSLFTAFVVVVLGIGLASCGSNSKDQDLAATPSASSTPTLSPPTKPAVVDENSPEGAANFVKYWVEVLNYAYVTGDTEQLKLISGADCLGCNAAIDLLDETYAEGGSFVGSSWSVGEIGLEFYEDLAYSSTEISTTEGKRLDKAQSKPVHYAASEMVIYAWLEFVDGLWSMADMDTEPLE